VSVATLPIPASYAAPPGWSTALPDWETRIAEGRSLIPDLPLCEPYADKALRLFKSLVCPDLEGLPTYGEICEEWVFDFVRAVFGSYDPETRQRYLSEFFLLVPKKNFKTGISAAIIVVAAILNERPDIELLLVAPTTKIAERAFKHARGICDKTPRLAGLFHATPTAKQLAYLAEDNPSTIVVRAADAEVITGSKAPYVLIDETHVFGSSPGAKGAFVEIRGGLSAPGSKGFLLQITTQSKSQPAGVFASELAQARDVRDGKLDLPMLPVLYELPEALAKDDGWKDPRTWPLVNPNLGRSVDATWLARQFTRAQAAGREELALFASQHLNIEIGTAQWGNGWAMQRYWDACADPSLRDLSELLARSEVAVVGIDGGGDDDLLGLTVMGRERDTRRALLWVHGWAQPEVLDRRKSIAPALEGFAADDELTICETPFQHVEDAVDICLEVQAAGLFPEEHGIAVDIAGLPELATAFELAELGDPLLRTVPQGWRLSSAIKSLPLKAKAGLLAHGGQRFAAWSIGNAKVELRRSNLFIEKQTAGAAKIDAVIAMLNADMFMQFNPVAAATGSYLNASELLVL
jgi:phage terminase large subunit-like protein